MAFRINNKTLVDSISANKIKRLLPSDNIHYYGISRVYEALNDEWTYTGTVGILTLCEDVQTKVIKFKIVDFDRENVIWSFELYMNFAFDVHSSNFVTFEGDSCIIGLLLAEGQDFNMFTDVLKEKIETNNKQPPPVPPSRTEPPRIPPPKEAPKVVESKITAPQQSEPPRNSFLADIQKGTTLKKVPASDKKEPKDVKEQFRSSPSQTTNVSQNNMASNFDNKSPQIVSTGNPLLDEMRRRQLKSNSSGELTPPSPVAKPIANIPPVPTVTDPIHNARVVKTAPPPPPPKPQNITLKSVNNNNVPTSNPTPSREKTVFDLQEGIKWDQLSSEWKEMFTSNGIDRSMLENPQLARKLVRAMKKFERQKKMAESNNRALKDEEDLAAKIRRASKRYL